MSMSPHIHIALTDAHEAEIARRLRQYGEVPPATRPRRAEERPSDGRMHRGLVRLHLAPARQPTPGC